jgi:hypothetical protein
MLLHARAVCSVYETRFVSKDRRVIVAEKSSFVVRCSNLHIFIAISYLTRSSIFVSDLNPPDDKVSSLGCGLSGFIQLLH